MVPQKMSYQAVVRNSSNVLVTNQPVGIKISILQYTATGTVVYAETQTPTTNANGLISIAIGTGAVITGAFSTIDWSAGPYFIKTEIDPSGGTTYSITSTSELLSVPYALYANDVLNKQWTESGSSVYYDKGFVGIGTQSPAAPLEVASAGIPHIKLNNTSAGVNYVQKITFWKGSTEKFAIGYDLWGTGDNLFTLYDTPNSIPVLNIKNSNVGIGITNPGTKLEVAGQVKITGGTPGSGKVLTSDASGLASWQTPAVITDASFIGTGTTASPLKLSSFGASYGQVLKWTGTEWNNTMDDTGPFSETANYIYNADSKKFGMGISVPTQKLSLADGGNTCYMNIQNSSTGYTSNDGMYLGTYGLNSYVSTYEAGSLYLGTGATIRLAILSDGKVGIGTLTPGYKLDVKGTANLNNGIATGPALVVNGDEAIWFDGTYFSWGYGGTWNYFKDAIGIDCQPGNGHLLAVNGVASKPGGGSWAAFSDVRLKDIHGQYTRGLSDILKLQPVIFSYKTDNELKLPSKSEYVGFIAQEVQKVFPETITETTSGYLEFDMHGVNVALVNAVKELKAENDALKARLEKLEERYVKE